MRQKMQARRRAKSVGETVVVMSCEGPFTAIEANGEGECKGALPLLAGGPKGVADQSPPHASLCQRQIARYPREDFKPLVSRLVDDVMTAGEGVNLPCRIVAQALVL